MVHAQLCMLITADLLFHTFGEEIPLPNSCAKDSATRKCAKKVSVESHDFIMAEIFRRVALLEDVDSANNTDSSGDVSGSSSTSSSAGEKSNSSDSE